MREHDELRHMMEEDADMEIIEIRARYETAIFELKDSNMRLKGGERRDEEEKSTVLLKDIDDHKAEVMKYQADLAKQISVTKGLEKEIESWKKELKEREENVQDKEKRIHELKKKNQELEKFKFVLDFKIKELRKQIEPKDDQISEMSKQIKEMEAQTENLKTTIESMEKEDKVLSHIMNITKKDKDEACALLKEREHFLRRFQGEMELALNQVTKSRDAKRNVPGHLWADMCAPRRTLHPSPAKMTHQFREKILAREVDELRNAIADTKTQYQRKTDVLSRKLWKMMQQNTSLIEEINVFRQEVTRLRTRLHLLDTALQGTNPRRKDDFAKIQALLKEVEAARLAELEKSGVIELYQHELRRLHLLLVLMREVVNNESNPGIVEMVARLQEVQLPPVVGQSKIDLVVESVANKVTTYMEDLKENLPGMPLPKTDRIGRPLTAGPTERKDAKKPDTAEAPADVKFTFPKPEAKAETPNRQLQFLKNLLSPSKATNPQPENT